MSQSGTSGVWRRDWPARPPGAHRPPRAAIRPDAAPPALARAALPGPPLIEFRPGSPHERELNGAFLPDGYEHGAEAELARLREQECRRARREALVLQATHGRPSGRPAPEIILDQSNLLPFHFLRTGDRLGRAVVKLERGDGAAGTGFLVAPGVLLTNHHVLPDMATAASARAVANYEVAPPPGEHGRHEVAPLDPASLFISEPELDFTFCGVAGLDFLGAVPLNRNSLGVLKDEHVNIIQHPRGRPKEVALRDSRVVKADHLVVRYGCDTEPGSSGSPVFNNHWKLVALHHASVMTDEPGARPSPDGLPQARYLNEGIRLSAIALWLETAEANRPGRREQVARLRAIFRGLDPQIGFFGALGRRADGRSAVEVVADSYRGGGHHLDVGFWDLRAPGRGFLDQLADLGWTLADMRVDLWVLVGVSPDAARALCDHLETNFRLDYDPMVPSPSLAVLRRRGRLRSVELLDRPGAPGGEPALRIRATTDKGEVVPVNLVPILPPDFAGDGPVPAVAVGPGAYPPDEAADWVLIGDAGRLGAAVEAAPGLDVVAETAGDDGAIAVLAGPGSRVEQVFVSPNQSPTADGDGVDRLAVADDREMPASSHAVGPRRPIALRLVLGRPDPPPPSDTVPSRAAPMPSSDLAPASAETSPPLSLADPAVERALLALLEPLVERLVARMRDPTFDAGGA